MKKFLYLFVPVIAGVLMFVSCNTSGSTASATKKDSVTMPMKVSYSSSFTISDSARYVQEVLQSYKDWEDNKLDNGKTYFADTISWDFSDGSKGKMKADSAIKHFQKDRDSLSSSKIDMISVVGLHSTDKNEDWVSVWYKQTDTYKTGKVDSNVFNDVNHIKGGKIDYWTSLRQALKPAKK